MVLVRLIKIRGLKGLVKSLYRPHHDYLSSLDKAYQDQLVLSLKRTLPIWFGRLWQAKVIHTTLAGRPKHYVTLPRVVEAARQLLVCFQATLLC